MADFDKNGSINVSVSRSIHIHSCACVLFSPPHPPVERAKEMDSESRRESLFILLPVLIVFRRTLSPLSPRSSAKHRPLPNSVVSLVFECVCVCVCVFAGDVLSPAQLTSQSASQPFSYFLLFPKKSFHFDRAGAVSKERGIEF